jgi:hypothetical protein
MNYEEFKKILKKNNLTLKRFSEISEVSYKTCTKWGKEDRPIPRWVNSWFKLYEKSQGVRNKEYEELLQLKESLQTVMSGVNAKA